MITPTATAYIEGVETEIVIGMGATEFLSSERIPYTVFSVISPTKIVVQQDIVEHQSDGSLRFVRNPSAPKITLTKREDRRWRRQGELMSGPTFGIGQRHAGLREDAA